jgi:teichoic acid transport system permease protein
MMGMIPWLFVSESVSNSTNSIVDNSYLVKKIVFRVSLLPFIKIISSLFVHLFFLLVLLIVYFIYDFDFTVYLFQIFYYILATVFLVVGISFITATLNVFFRDTGQVVGMIINFLFWLTPIFWSMDIVNEKYKTLFKINPLYYIVEGYRDTFINHRWFWEVPGLTIYFWCVTVCTILIGAALFRKLRPHFADVL